MQVTLIDRCNYHLFQPLLYQVATGALSPANIASPLRNILKNQKNTRVLLAEATHIDAANRRVILSDGEIAYDTLIVATGSSHQYFGHDEWEKFAPGLKTVEDATDMRRRILLAFEAAEREADPEKLRAWMTFVMVGAGPTGVELAGALGEIANDTLRHDFRDIDPSKARIFLVEGAERVLPPYPPTAFGGRAQECWRGSASRFAPARSSRTSKSTPSRFARGERIEDNSHAHGSLGGRRARFAAGAHPWRRSRRDRGQSGPGDRAAGSHACLAIPRFS